MLTIHEIFAQYPKSDKGTRHSYLEVYEDLLVARRDSIRSVLELGVETGDSLKAWAEYFPKARILGLDKSLTSWLPQNHDRSSILVRFVDTTKPSDLEQIARTYGPFDLIVDDGCHHLLAQVAAWATLWPWVRHDGLYVIEDIASEESAHMFVDVFGGEAYIGRKCEDDNLVVMRMK